MTRKFHSLKVWEGKDCSKVEEKLFISVEAVQEWIADYKQEDEDQPFEMGINCTLRDLQLFLNNKK